MNPTPIFSDPRNWASMIGPFMLNFGHLEFLVLVYFEKRLPSEAFAAIREKPFKDRIEKAKAEAHPPE